MNRPGDGPGRTPYDTGDGPMSSTIDIPGGQATFRGPDEITARGRRAILLLAQEIGVPRFQAITEALNDPDAAALLGQTRAERALMLTMPDATIFAHLQSWTLDRPLPETVEDVGDLPVPLYDALLAEATRISQEMIKNAPRDADGQVIADRFGVGAVEDLGSPTGASVGSNGRSTGAAARRAPSDHKKPSGGRSTATARRSPA